MNQPNKNPGITPAGHVGGAAWRRGRWDFATVDAGFHHHQQQFPDGSMVVELTGRHGIARGVPASRHRIPAGAAGMAVIDLHVPPAPRRLWMCRTLETLLAGAQRRICGASS